MSELVELFYLKPDFFDKPKLHVNYPEDLDDLSDGELLELAIEKWAFIVQALKANPNALCSRYWYDSLECEGCPVSTHTGVRWCEETPFSDYSFGNYLKVAKKELKFLKGLRK